MNSKPKSWAALKKSVEAADIQAMPSSKLGAKRADKLILICIAEAGSDVGAGARPGNAALERASGLRWSQCHEHIVLMEKAGLLSREAAVGGRGLATVYRIVWNHPVFPDRSPNGREWFVDKPSGLEDENPPVSFDKPSGLEAETIRLETANHPGSDTKPSGLEAKPSGRRPEHILIPSREHPHPSPPIPAAEKTGWEQEGWRAFVQRLSKAKTKLGGQELKVLGPGLMENLPRKAQREALQAMAREIGPQLGYDALFYAVTDFATRDMNGVKMPWVLFCSEPTLHLEVGLQKAKQFRDFCVKNFAQKECVELVKKILHLDREFFDGLTIEAQEILRSWKPPNDVYIALVKLKNVLLAYRAWKSPMELTGPEAEQVATEIDLEYGLISKHVGDSLRALLFARLEEWGAANPVIED